MSQYFSTRFPNVQCERLYELSLDGGPNEQYGDCSEPPCRWWGLMTKTGVHGAANVILTEDSQGFVDYETFRSAKKAHAQFDKIVTEVDAEMHEYHEEPVDGCSLCEEADS